MYKRQGFLCASRPYSLCSQDVRIDTKLNKALWSGGIRSVPKRVRVQIQRLRSDDEDAKEEFYSLVTHVEGDFRGLGVRVVEA